MGYIIGVDIGGTKCAVTLGEYAQGIQIIDKITFPTEVDKGPYHSLNRIVDTVYAILQQRGKEAKDIKGIGISCGGPLDSKRGIIMSPPNLPGWSDIHIVEFFNEKFGVPAYLQNDANACALAEWKFGAAKGYRNVVFLTFGTGMGAGLILDGRLYSGTNDMAGEVGHVRLENFGPVGYGKTGSFEGFCSGGGIAQLARMKIIEKMQQGITVSFCKDQQQLDKLTAKDVAEAAKAGDELAQEIYKISGEHLGRGLAILIDILNPEIIVIGSIFTRTYDLLWPWVQKEIARESLPRNLEVCRVVPAALGENIGDYAALAVALGC